MHVGPEPHIAQERMFVHAHGLREPRRQTIDNGRNLHTANEDWVQQMNLQICHRNMYIIKMDFGRSLT